MNASIPSNLPTCADNRPTFETHLAGQGIPTYPKEVKSLVKRGRQLEAAAIEMLLTESWLHEVTVPPKDQTNLHEALIYDNFN